MSCQVNLCKLVEYDVIQLNKIVIPLGYHPESDIDTTYNPVLCSPTSIDSNLIIPDHSSDLSVQKTDFDLDNNFRNNANITPNTSTKVLNWVKGSRVLNLSNMTITPPIQSLPDNSLSFVPTPEEPDFGHIFSDFEFHFRNLRLKHFFHRDPTPQVLPHTATLLTPYPDSDSNSCIDTLSDDESLAFKHPSFKNKSTFDPKHVQKGHLDTYINSQI